PRLVLLAFCLLLACGPLVGCATTSTSAPLTLTSQQWSYLRTLEAKDPTTLTAEEIAFMEMVAAREAAAYQRDQAQALDQLVWLSGAAAVVGLVAAVIAIGSTADAE
ncbi:MAG: hypothetical protein AAFU38_15995, partial [Bacteroidota bacterium]